MKAENHYQKSLPHDAEAERIVLGSILVTPERFAKIGPSLDTVDFFLEKNKRVWSAIQHLAEANLEPNMLAVGHYLMEATQLQSVGGLDYICSLQDNVTDMLDVDHYVQEIKKNTALRSLIGAFDSAILRCYDKDDCGQIMSETTERVKQINRPFSIKDRFQKVGDLIQQHGGMDQFLATQVCKPGIDLPFPRLNYQDRGLHPQKMTILAARPSFGKTAFALQIADHVGAADKGVVIISLESPTSDLVIRMACAKAQVSLDGALRGTLSPEDRVRLAWAMAAINEAPIYFNDKPNCSIAGLQGDLRALKETCGIELVIIDYLQLMASGRTTNNRNEAVSEISRGLKIALMELKLAGLVLSQLVREPAKGVWRAPILTDLRDSGAIEQDADEVWFLHKRQPRYDKGTRRLLIAKQRNGPLGQIDYAFDGPCTRFEELERNEIWPEEKDS